MLLRDCTDAQADMSLRRTHVSEDMFFHDAVPFCILNRLDILTVKQYRLFAPRFGKNSITSVNHATIFYSKYPENVGKYSEARIVLK